MNTCDTCKWWTAVNGAPSGYLACRSPRVTTEAGGGESIRYKSQYEFRGGLYDRIEDIPGHKSEIDAEAHCVRTEEADTDGALASASDYYPADFYTGPKFGCIHHEPK